MPNTYKHQHFFHSTEDCILLRTPVKIFKEFERPSTQQWTFTGRKDFSEVPAKLLCIHAGIPAAGIGIPVCSGKKGEQKYSTTKEKGGEDITQQRKYKGKKIDISDLHRAIVQSHPPRIFLHVVHHLKVVILLICFLLEDDENPFFVVHQKGQERSTYNLHTYFPLLISQGENKV